MVKLYWAIVLLSWSSTLFAIGPTDLSRLFGDLLPASDVSLAYLGDLTGNVSGLSLMNSNPLMGNIFNIFNGVVLSVVLFIVSSSMTVSILTTAQHGEMLGKKWSTIWVPTRAGLGISLLIPTASGYSPIQVTILWIIMQGVAGANALWGTILDNFENGNALSSSNVTALNSTSITNTQIQTLFQGAVCAGYLNELQQSSAAPSSSAVQTALQTALNKETILLYPITYNSTYPNYYMFTTDTLAYKFAQGQITADQASVCGYGNFSYTPPTSSYQASYIDNFIRTQQSILFSNITTLASLVVTAYTNYVQNPIFPFDQTIQSLGSSDVIPFATSIGTAWAQLTPSKGISVPEPNGTSNMSAAARRNGWMFAGSYYFMLTAAGQASAKIPLTINTMPSSGSTPLNTTVGPLVNTGFINQLNSQIATNIMNPNNQNTWTNLVMFYKPDIQPNSTINLSNVGGNSDTSWVTSFINGVVLAPITNAFSDLTNKWQSDPTNPIVKLANLGDKIITIGEGAIWAILPSLVGLSLISNICESLNPVGPAFNNMMRFVFLLVFSVAALLWATGTMLAIYLPLIPFIVYLGTTIGWLIGAIEAAIAAPLIAIGLATPSEDEFGKAAQSLVLIMNAFLRPALIVLGFTAAAKLIIVVFDMLNFGFNLGADFKSNSIFAIMAIVGIYGGVSLTIAHRAFSLIYLVPDKVIRWIGGHGEDSGAAELLSKAESYSQKGSAAGGAALQTTGSFASNAGKSGKKK